MSFIAALPLLILMLIFHAADAIAMIYFLLSFHLDAFAFIDVYAVFFAAAAAAFSPLMPPPIFSDFYSPR